MRILAFALLLALSGSVAALAQPGPSYYTDRATQERAQREANGDYHDYWDPPGQRYYDRAARDRDIQNRHDAERYRDEQAYERGRRDAERDRQNSGGSGNDIVNSIGRMFNNR